MKNFDVKLVIEAWVPVIAGNEKDAVFAATLATEDLMKALTPEDIAIRETETEVEVQAESA